MQTDQQTAACWGWESVYSKADAHKVLVGGNLRPRTDSQPHRRQPWYSNRKPRAWQLRPL